MAYTNKNFRFTTTVVQGWTFVVGHTDNEYGTAFIKSIKTPNGKPVAKGWYFTGTGSDFRNGWGCAQIEGQYFNPSAKTEASLVKAFTWLVENWLKYDEATQDLIKEGWDAAIVAARESAEDDGIAY